MRFLNKKRVFALVVLSFYLFSPVASWACTTIMVGKNVSTTGRYLFARSEDSAINGAKKFIVVPAGFYKGGVEYILNRSNQFKWTFSHDSYKFTAVPDTTRHGINALGGENASKDAVPHWEDGYHFTFDGDGVNEKGLALSATTTHSLRSGIFPSATGPQWTEQTMAKVLLAEAASCKEALDVVDKIVAEGPNRQRLASEMIHLADQNESWLFEVVGPYHYVASRVPDDCFAVIANAMFHQYFDENDPANFRSNFKPNTYAEQNGFARYQVDEKGVKRVNISLTYGGGSNIQGVENAGYSSNTGVNGEYSTYRRWRGMTMFAPSLAPVIKPMSMADYFGGGGTAATSADTGRTHPNYIKPDKKISPMDIALMHRDRYAGSPFDLTYSPQYFDANGVEVREGHQSVTVIDISKTLPPGSVMPEPTPNGSGGVRSIGTSTQQHVHTYDVGGKLPPDVGARFFISIGQAETCVYLPYYGNITDTHPKMKHDITALNTATTGLGINSKSVYNPDSAAQIFHHTGFLARGDRKNYVKPIQEFWRAYELKLYEETEKIVEPELLRLHKEVSPAASAKYVTDYTIAVTDQALNAAIRVHDALEAHIAAAPFTLFKVPAGLEYVSVLPPVEPEPDPDDKCSGSGCDAGLAYAAMGFFAVLMFMRKRSK
jgi:dipeptidase